jgi:hypothetical protein
MKTYYRNHAGFWFLNGRSVKEHQVPVGVRRMAHNMTPECTIKVP